MIYAFKIENDKLELDLKQILMYPLLAKIYKRDTSDNKEFAYKEFKFIYFIADKKGYCRQAGLSKKEAIKYGIKNAGLDSRYEPDNIVLKAIELVKSQFNITPVEDLIETTIVGLNFTTKLVNMYSKALQDALDKGGDDLEAISDSEKNLKGLLNATNDIPNRISKLVELREQWDKAEKGVSSIRGGKEYKASYDGVDERESISSDGVQSLE